MLETQKESHRRGQGHAPNATNDPNTPRNLGTTVAPFQRIELCSAQQTLAERKRRMEQVENAITPSSGPGITSACLLADLVALIAMMQRRAPLPISAGLKERVSRRNSPASLLELGDLARRYLFLGDERMLLAEMKRPRMRSTSPKWLQDAPGSQGSITAD